MSDMKEYWKKHRIKCDAYEADAVSLAIKITRMCRDENTSLAIVSAALSISKILLSGDQSVPHEIYEDGDMPESEGDDERPNG